MSGLSNRPLSLLLAGFLLAWAYTGAAHAGEPTSIAVVDVQRLLHESLAGRSLDEEIERYSRTLSESVATEESRLRTEEQELAEQRSLLSPEIFADRRRQFEGKVVGLQRQVRDQQRALEKTYAQGVEQIGAVITEILNDMIEAGEYDLVLKRSQTLVGHKALDITDRVMEQLNERIPKVSVKLED